MSPAHLACQLESHGMLMPTEQDTYRRIANLIRWHLVPRWTKERPTHPGVYWVRGRANREDEVLVVRYSWPATNPGNPADLYIMDINGGGCVPIRIDDGGVEWCEIAEPVES